MSGDIASIEAANGPTRHRDEGRWLGAFLGDHCVVRCPRCGHCGEVRYECLDSGETVARFACASCALALESSPGSTFSDRRLLPGMKWYGRVRLSGKRTCGYCGYRWLRHESETHASELRPASFATTVRCPVCGKESPLELDADRALDDDIGCEPVFGLMLAHSESVALGKTVWAYNRPHLSELKRFVGAQLRERSSVRNSTYFSRLPAWLKSARHRKKILAAIERIERRMSETQGRM